MRNWVCLTQRYVGRKQYCLCLMLPLIHQLPLYLAWPLDRQAFSFFGNETELHFYLKIFIMYFKVSGSSSSVLKD